MKFSSTLIGSTMIIPFALALPKHMAELQNRDSTVSSTTSAAVKVIQQNVQGPNISALEPVPSDIDANTVAFLQKYQQYSTQASDFVGAKNADYFTSAGYCFTEYPCFSLDRPAVAKIGGNGEISQTQITGLMDQLLSDTSIVFDNSNHDNVFNGLKKVQDGAVLEVIAPPSNMSSAVLTGMVFDMFKIQSESTDVNSVRAVQAKTDGDAMPILALCLYPDGVDAEATKNFCLGKELDGSYMPTTTGQSNKVKRFSLDGLLSGFCHVIDVPLLCEN